MHLFGGNLCDAVAAHMCADGQNAAHEQDIGNIRIYRTDHMFCKDINDGDQF